MKKSLWIVLSVLLVAGVSLSGCGAKKKDKTASAASTTTTTTSTASTNATAAKASATSGATVKAGEILFTFKPKDGAETVNIAGSFQGWNPSDPNYTMTKKGDSFELKLDLEAGKYMWKFVIDGNWVQSMEDYKGQFTPDSGTYVDDGFGGKNCVLEAE
jgi:ABC-type oligopeptide transport system substrate-binding subunit